MDIAFAPWMVAGVRAQWESMQPYVRERSDVRSHVVGIHPYREGGVVERLPGVPWVIKGTARSMLCAASLLRLPKLDALWLQAPRTALPYLLTRGRWDGTSVLVATDATAPLLANFGSFYSTTSPPNSFRGRTRAALESMWTSRIRMMLPWSEWAARSLRDDEGIPPERITVMPPGINLDRWPSAHREPRETERLHLLFVGGDFHRKGGDLLLDVFTRHFSDRCDLHIITQDVVPEEPGVHVYRGLGPNDPVLRALYARSDIFVLPTRADCFSIASIEAMATGLPVITCAVGGIPEIVSDGRSGFLIAPDDGRAVRDRLEGLISNPRQRRAMGEEGRRIVESRFDAARNTAQVMELMVRLAREREL